jgi:hypothetical protein
MRVSNAFSIQPSPGEVGVELGRDQSLRATRFQDVAAEQREAAQYFENVAPFFRMRCRKNRQAVAPFVDLEALRNLGWDKGLIRHRRYCRRPTAQDPPYNVLYLFSSPFWCWPLSIHSGPF